MKVQMRIDELLTLRASEWFEIMKDPSPADRAAFIEWLGESRRHVREYLEVAALDEAVGGMPPGLREDVDALVAKVATPVTVLPARVRPQPGARRFAGRVPARTWWTAAASLLLGAMLWATLHDPYATLSTQVGEQRTFALSDASLVMLNTDSRLRWRFDETGRHVDLQRGEALFKVTSNKQRPFEVRTPAGTIRVLGTQFNVYARADGSTRVSVLEGLVRLGVDSERSRNAPAAVLELTAGQEADIQNDGHIELDPAPAVERTMAWRERRLIFDDATLEQMVGEFNRYNRAPRLRLVGVPPGTLRFAGIFNADDPLSLTALLQREGDLVVTRRNNEMVIRGR